MAVVWGIDVGVGSVGFSVIEIDDTGVPVALVDGVSRVFSASEGGADRRLFRTARRQHQRRTARLSRLRARLCQLFDVPAAFDAAVSDLPLRPGSGGPGVTDRVHLRSLGLTQALSGGDVARALMHLAKNRGRRLTRGLKDDATEDQTGDGRSLADAANHTAARLRDLAEEQRRAATPGNLLYSDLLAGTPTRQRKDRPDAPVFTRHMVEAEVDLFLSAQQRHHPAVLTDEVVAELSAAVKWEKEPPAPRIGPCCYGLGEGGEIERRVSRANDLFQTKRIYEELNHIRLRNRETAAERPLTLEQRDLLAQTALNGETITAARLRSLLGLGKGKLADLSSLDERKSQKGSRLPKEIKAHPMAAAFRAADGLDLWTQMPQADRQTVTELLRDMDDPDALAADLAARFDLTSDQIDVLVKFSPPAGYASAGPTATARLLAELQRDVISLYEAEQRAGLTVAGLAEISDEDPLPYYGKLFPLSCVGASQDPRDPLEQQFGRIPNPAVHAVLGQIRKLAKIYLKRHGQPVRINIELARDLTKSAEEREEIARTNMRNQNQRLDRMKVLMEAGIRPTRRALLREQLWEWQSGICLYSGKSIKRESLHRGEFDIDHVLPYSRTQDNRKGNLVLYHVAGNSHKANKSPYEAFAAGYEGSDYAQILKRVEQYRPGSLWRFQADAMERYEDQNRFRDRYLSDTCYIAKMTAAYLRTVLRDEDKAAGVLSLSGGMTAQLRRLWSLDGLMAEMMVEQGRLDEAILTPLADPEEEAARRKSLAKVRWDHRHHLLDAIVIACVTRSDVQRINTLSARVSDPSALSEALLQMQERGESLFRAAGMPWQDGFRARVKAFLASDQRSGGTERVSHKRDHGTDGALHAQTNYSVIATIPGHTGKYVAASYMDLALLKSLKEVEGLRSRTELTALRHAIAAGETLSWGGADPIGAVDNLERSLNQLVDGLLQQFNKTPSHDDKGEELKEYKRLALAVAAHRRATGQRRVKRLKNLSLVILKDAISDGQAPRQAVEPGSNDRLVFWRDAALTDRLEVVTTLDANRPNFQETWQQTPGAVLLLRLRKGDVVEMDRDGGDASAGRALFVARSIGLGDMQFAHLADARDSKAVRSRETRVASLSAFLKRRPQLVILDPDGTEVWRSKKGN